MMRSQPYCFVVVMLYSCQNFGSRFYFDCHKPISTSQPQPQLNLKQ